MKSKTLITMAVASTFGLSAAAFAGSGHQVLTPSSPNESYPSAVLNEQGQFHGSFSTAMAPSDSISETTGHDLALSDSSDWSASFDQMAEADAGDIYLIGFAPMDSWDYYLIEDSSDSLASLDSETYYLVPVDYIVLIEDGSMTPQDQVSMISSEPADLS